MAKPYGSNGKRITSFQIADGPRAALVQIAGDMQVSVSDLVRASLWSAYGDRHPDLEQLRTTSLGTAVASQALIAHALPGDEQKPQAP